MREFYDQRQKRELRKIKRGPFLTTGALFLDPKRCPTYSRGYRCTLRKGHTARHNFDK